MDVLETGNKNARMFSCANVDLVRGEFANGENEGHPGPTDRAKRVSEGGPTSTGGELCLIHRVP